MQIISNFHKDTQTDKPKPGSYEWWYFDAMSADGYSIVIIFYEGNPFSRRYIQSIEKNKGKTAGNFPAVSISVYKNGTPLFYSFEEVEPSRAFFSVESPAGAVGENRFNGQHAGGRSVRYNLQINQQVNNGDAIRGELIFEGAQPMHTFGEDECGEDASHAWNLVLPACRVQADLVISGYSNHHILFDGAGYHDHNSGKEPMKESFTEWYWGRYHIDDATFIYYLMNMYGSWSRRAWFISNGTCVTIKAEGITLGDLSYSAFGLKTSKKIEFSQRGLKAFVQKQSLIDNGPFYQRYEGRVMVERDGKLKQGRGISEYIKPARIYNRIFWPLVNMRIKYPGRAHWVQKSPVLYRWTW